MGGMDEIGGRGDREPFLSRGGRVVLGLVATALASSLVLTQLGGNHQADPADGAPAPSATASAPTPAQPTAAAPSRPDRVGFIGLPPAAAGPSDPPTGELVVQVWTRLARAWLYADGRLITLHYGDRPEGANPASTGLIERRLTTAGVEYLRSYVARSGRGLGPARTRPAIDPTRPVVRVGDRLQVVRKPSPACDERSCTRVTNPGSWLPARMWQERRPAAYVPASFAVCYGLRGSGDTADLREAPAVPDASLFGRAGAADRRLPPDWPCSVVSTQRATRIVQTLRRARVLRDSSVESTVLAFVVDVRSPVPGSPPHEARLFFEPLLPGDGWPCSACS
jgi:hypothetical protein